MAATKFNAVRRPTDSVMFTEQLAHGGWTVIDSNDLLASYHRQDYVTGGYGDAIFAHPGKETTKTTALEYFQGKLNYLFFDGHVETRHRPPYSFGGTNPWGLPTYAQFVGG
ncbi:MAG TPA: hypothetical protein VIL86_06735 [Tepidisphaeraceae bacterium]